MSYHTAFRLVVITIAVAAASMTLAMIWLFLHPSTLPEKNTLRLSPDELRKSFDSHEREARQTYHSKQLEIIGVVTAILHRSVPDKGVERHVWNIELADTKGGKAFVWATFECQRPDVREGDEVVVHGTLDAEPLSMSQQVRLTMPRIIRGDARRMGR